MTQAASKAKARTPGRAPKIDWQAALAQHDRWLRKVVYCRLPENLTIVVTKQGSQPAKVAVSRGDAKWDVTEEQLDKLPDDVRPHVERMLGHYSVGFGQPWTWDLIPELKPRESPRGPAGRAQPSRSSSTRCASRSKNSASRSTR